MKIVKDHIRVEELKEMATKMFGDLVKAVVDIEQDVMAVDLKMHADGEYLLLENGSKHENLWGITIYPEQKTHDTFIAFESLINYRPLCNNKNRYIEDQEIRNKITKIVTNLIQ